MVAYGVGLLPLIRQLKNEFPARSQPWYADDAAAGGKFVLIGQFMARLCELGPAYGYFPEPDKSILVTPEVNFDRARAALGHFNFKITAGSRYLGSYIGDKIMETAWVEEKISGWSLVLDELTGVAKRYPQSAFAGAQKSLWQQWNYLMRVIPGIGHLFADIERKIHRQFLPTLLDREVEDITNDIRTVVALPSKCAGMSLTNPLHVRVRDNYLAPRKKVAEKNETFNCHISLLRHANCGRCCHHQRRGDCLLHGFWERNTSLIVDFRFGNLDAASHVDKDYRDVLPSWEAAKKRKHKADCQLNRRHFTPFVSSRDAILGAEATSFTRALASHLANKWNRDYSATCGCVKGRLGLTIVRATTRCLYGSRVPARHISSTPAWSDGLGLGLWTTMSDPPFSGVPPSAVRKADSSA